MEGWFVCEHLSCPCRGAYPRPTALQKVLHVRGEGTTQYIQHLWISTGFSFLSFLYCVPFPIDLWPQSQCQSSRPRLRLPSPLNIAPIHGAPRRCAYWLCNQTHTLSQTPSSSFRCITLSLQRNVRTRHASVLRPQIRSNGVLAIPHAKAFVPLHTFLIVHRLDSLMSALLLVLPSMLSGAHAQAHKCKRSRRSLCAHLRTPGRAILPSARTSGDRMSALIVFNRTVSTIWHNRYEGSTLTYHWWLQWDLLLKS